MRIMNTARNDGRGRGGQRGAALVEAAVVIPVFIVLLGGMMFIHQLLFKTVGSMQVARGEAWVDAMGRCGAAGGGGGAPAVLMKLESEMPNAPGADRSLTNPGGEAVGTASATATVNMGSGEGGFQQHVTSHAPVWCNDRTEAGTVVGVFKYLLGQSD
jgi:hypothetical protein